MFLVWRLGEKQTPARETIPILPLLAKLRQASGFFQPLIWGVSSFQGTFSWCFFKVNQQDHCNFSGCPKNSTDPSHVFLHACTHVQVRNVMKRGFWWQCPSASYREARDACLFTCGFLEPRTPCFLPQVRLAQVAQRGFGVPRAKLAHVQEKTHRMMNPQRPSEAVPFRSQSAKTVALGFPTRAEEDHGAPLQVLVGHGKRGPGVVPPRIQLRVGAQDAAAPAVPLRHGHPQLQKLRGLRRAVGPAPAPRPCGRASEGSHLVLKRCFGQLSSFRSLFGLWCSSFFLFFFSRVASVWTVSF